MRGRQPEAISLYQEADTLFIDYSFKERLGELYEMTGNKKESDRIINEIINSMSKDAERGEGEEGIGHYSDRELAYAFLLKNDYDKALKHALTEYNRRPNNIDVNETVAWVYYNMGEYQKSIPFINAALKTNSKNPVLLSHAGMIYSKVNQLDKAKILLQDALRNDPFIDIQLKSEAKAVLNKLQS